MTNDTIIVKWERFIVKRNICKKFLLLLFGIAFTLLLFNSMHTLYRLSTNFFVISNSIGEDGKVFFAKKFQQGQLPFANGEIPPYYPSFHGVLTHVSVGMIGRLFSCSTQGLYYVGRCISVLSLLVSLLVVVKIFRELHVKPIFIFFAMVLLFAPGVMHAFATSYRPDYWINAIYLLVYYLVCHKKNTRCEVTAVAVIVVAYLIKPTAIIYMGALLLVLLFRQHWQKIFAYSILFTIFLSMAIWLLQLYSSGLFLSSFAHGMNVPFSIQGALKFFIKHTLLYLTLLPMFAVFSIKNEKMLCLLIFWLVSFSGSALTSLRAGVGLNYYLSTYYFTVILITYWWKDLNFRAINTQAFPFVGFFLLWLIIAMIFPTYAILKHTPNAAIATSLKFDKERTKVAQWINRNGFVCFSDDAGLNILLEKPQIVYPILLKQFIQSRSLSQKHFIEPLQTKKYDFVILTSAETQQLNDIPDYFWVELHKNYEISTVEFKTNYILWKKKP